MSPVHGKQGQPYARPAASSQPQGQWGQASQGGGGRAPQGQPQGQPQAPGYQNAGYAPQQNPYGQPSYGQYQQPAQTAGGNAGYQAAPLGGGYGQPDYPPFSTPATGGRSASSYAPQFEPLAPALAVSPHSQQPAPAQRTTPYSQGHAPQGYEYAAPAQSHPGHHDLGYGAPAQHTNAGWGSLQQAADSRGFDLGTYGSAHQPQTGYGVPAETAYAPEPGFAAEPHFGNEPHFGTEARYAPQQVPQGNEWVDQGGYAEHGGYDQGYNQRNVEYIDQSGADLGFGQPAGGELDQAYQEEEGQEYEEEAPSRGRRPLMMVAVLAGAIVFGGGMTYGYKAIFGGSSAGDPPVIKSAAEPSKFKPADGGGKQFAHTDSKIMGRLGDGSTVAAAAETDNGSDMDANGTRKVSTLVVGRDGSIQAPAPDESAEAPTPGTVAVPGLTLVDGLGTARQATVPSTVVNAPPAPPPAQKAAAVAKTAAATKTAAVVNPAPPAEPTGSIEPEEAAVQPAAKPAKKVKTAAAALATGGSTSVATTGSGFVAVLASVPRSDSSRMDALKRFADMQQKYAGVLSGKTPDVAEANLGTKGSYHRLVVGPPGSREQASSLCSQLKSQGYNDCWVTTY